jgi:hypothetical protein
MRGREIRDPHIKRSRGNDRETMIARENFE